MELFLCFHKTIGWVGRDGELHRFLVRGLHSDLPSQILPVPLQAELNGETFSRSSFVDG
ncbi:hypothetical protein BS47DRAFT_1349315 [Hydnum rufescens UP504]|uniref:Uncharacterized protein n=1 Tax=Hydnum rufescens UP504 TaxID=1448309 RepID=A0A9P6DT58_9AGAM|nr:hypothetical protein BS47DRAFT_1349315 [Hydnum rufescens UP504]